MDRLSRIAPIACLLVSLLPTDSAARGFIAARSYEVGLLPVAAVSADFNHDGRQDLAVANTTGTLAVFLAKNHGEFLPAQDYRIPYEAIAVTSADFNGDGNMDVAAVSQLPTSVTVLLGSADGTFTSSSFSFGVTPTNIVAADFDDDGNIDLAVTDYGPGPSSRGALYVLLGNGDGTFKNTQNFSAGDNPICLATADLNADGKLDVVVGNDYFPGGKDALSVLLGNGDGTFQPFISISPPGLQRVNSIAVADLNHDSIPDLAVASTHVAILWGNGDGTFRAGNYYDVTPYQSQQLCLADLNRDGFLDLLVATNEGVDVFRGRGDGNFQAAVLYGVGERFIVADRLGAGGTLGVAAGGQTTVNVASVNDDGSLQASPVYPVTSNNIAVGDFNGDHKHDLAITGADLSILLGNGDGTFQPPRTGFDLVGYPRSMVEADFNGDSKADVSITFDGNVQILLGNGDGTFHQSQSIRFGTEPEFQAVADLNHDGDADLAIADALGNLLFVLLGNGDGTFQNPVDYDAGGAPEFPVVADFNGDGHLDLAVTNPAEATVSLLLGNGDGTFRRRIAIGPVGGSYLIASDFNNDGKQDLAVGGPGTRVLLGNGDATFQPPLLVSPGYGPMGVTDVNEDGKRDLIISSQEPGQFYLESGNGDGTFRTTATYAGGTFNSYFVIADLNGDRAPDIASITVQDDVLFVFLNSGGAEVSLSSSINPSKVGQPVTFTASVTATSAIVGVPSGRVVFEDGSSRLGTSILTNGTATLTTASLAAGAHRIKAVYSGDVNFNRTHSPVVIQRVEE